MIKLELPYVTVLADGLGRKASAACQTAAVRVDTDIEGRLT